MPCPHVASLASLTSPLQPSHQVSIVCAGGRRLDFEAPSKNDAQLLETAVKVLSAGTKEIANLKFDDEVPAKDEPVLRIEAGEE